LRLTHGKDTHTMKYLICPDVIDLAMTTPEGEVARFARQISEDKVVREASTMNWWAFLLNLVAEESFYEGLSTNLESIEVGQAFREAVIKARDTGAKVIPLEDDVAKRAKKAANQVKLVRAAQHNLLDWMQRMNKMQDKDPTVALQEKQN
jgi:hypothetical protein